MPYIDLAGLSRFDAAQKDALARDYALLRDMQWTRSEKAGAVSLWPAGGTPLEPSVDFLFSETPPASGDKSPSNPSTITGVDSLYVRVCGKNLFPVDFLHTTVRNGETYQRGNIVAINNNGVYSLSVASGAQSVSSLQNLYILRKEYNDAVLQPGTYTLSGYTRDASMPSGTQIQLQLYPLDGSDTITKYCYNGPVTFTTDRPCNVNAYIRTPEGTTFPAGFTCSPQLEMGSEATEFEPGLLNNYTISLGSTYYGGTLDVASGVMTVTWWGHVFDGTENTLYKNNSNNSTYPVDYHIPASGSWSSKVVCTHFVSGSSPTNVYANNANYDGAIIFRDNETFSTIDAFKSFLVQQYANGTPVVCVIRIVETEQYTVQLDPVSISALTQADKYTPRLNTVYTDASSVQVGYVKSPIRDEYELQQAVIAQGGNV